MLHHAFNPPERPRMTPEQHVERLKQELASCQTTMIDMQSRLAEARGRLGLISKIVGDDARCRRAPGVAWAAVRAALYAEPDRLRDLRPDAPIL
ncbi:hypothetical protein [Plantactinospora soyae]|uniref:Uncharacterized protein n=1 Tax=Plantactinospora soyae TaxID=1544732 RepID=A0A927M5Z9_9ACTN|nr:hypothetical protein [Plantactinospora soyae]MBE1487251.1 hypothetical protein [Plantactinospora soyae]